MRLTGKASHLIKLIDSMKYEKLYKVIVQDLL